MSVNKLATICAATLLCSCARGFDATDKTTESKSARPELPAMMQAITKKIQQQIPELVAPGAATQTPASARVWKGEEYVAEFVRAEHVAADPRKRAKSGLPYLALRITVASYASPADAQKDVQRSLRLRPAMTPPQETYKGASLYRYAPGAANVICQAGPYVVEVSPLPRSGLDQSAVMKAVDAVLAEIESPAKPDAN